MTPRPQVVPAGLVDELRRLGQAGRIVVLTGAGVSAESGIPTFRGEEGYWTVGSREYRPMEMATRETFRRMPDEVWRWYLYRRGMCRAAQPNPGHLAVAQLEDHLEDRFTLVTQNVDGLHLRAGNTPQRSHQIHGNIDFMRCANACSTRLFPVPRRFDTWTKDATLNDADQAQLVCLDCNGPARPHVLWFDEYYDEALLRADSSMQAARAADILLVVGTSGTTNLPLQVGSAVAEGGGTIVDINPHDNPFGQLAQRVNHGFTLRGHASVLLPELAGHVTCHGGR